MRRYHGALVQKTGCLGRCAECGKLAFVTRASVQDHLRRRFPGYHFRVYRCILDDRWWHYTSQDARQSEGRRREAVFRAASAGVLVTEQDAEAVTRYVRAVVQATGTGPLWSELQVAMGWPHALMPSIMTVLRKRGWVDFTTEERSLRPGAHGLDAIS